MNHFPDQVNSTFISFWEDANIFQLREENGNTELHIEVLMGPNAGYQAIHRYNGRLLMSVQEIMGDYNERIDFDWLGGRLKVAKAKSSRGEWHIIKIDQQFRLVSWTIQGQNSDGAPKVLRYLRNFWDKYGVIDSSIRYEEHGQRCLQVYQQFQYGIDADNWRARHAQIFKYPYLLGSEAYHRLEIPADIMVFPETFDEKAAISRQIRIHEGLCGLDLSEDQQELLGEIEANA